MFNFGKHWPKTLLDIGKTGRGARDPEIQLTPVPRDHIESLLDRLKTIYKEAFRRFEPKRSMPPIHVTFYPYIGINHTIRIRKGEICRDMPLACHRGLAYILVGKLRGKKIPAEAHDVYNAWIKSDKIRERAAEQKRERGWKIVTSSKGDVYDLDAIFDRLNSKYFRNRISKPQ